MSPRAIFDPKIADEFMEQSDDIKAPTYNLLTLKPLLDDLQAALKRRSLVKSARKPSRHVALFEANHHPSSEIVRRNHDGVGQAICRRCDSNQDLDHLVPLAVRHTEVRVRACIIILEGKGGVSKSTTASIAVEAVRQDGKRTVKIVDCDTTNSSMVSQFDQVELIDPIEEEAAGKLLAAIQSDNDYLVVDTGARSEARFLNVILPRLRRHIQKLGIPVVVLRPITLSSFVQNSALAFAERASELGVRTVFVRILAQGRVQGHFADWERSAGLAKVRALGVKEFDLSDAGVRWGDEVPAFGLSFSAAAAGDFSRVDPDLLEDAQKIFTFGIQAHLGFWVEENCERLLAVLKELGIKL